MVEAVRIISQTIETIDVVFGCLSEVQGKPLLLKTLYGTDYLS